DESQVRRARWNHRRTVTRMNNRQKILIQDSFEKVRSMGETAANLFYTRLFTVDPALRVLFNGDLKEQGRKLMETIGIAVKGLDNPRHLVLTVAELGRRHAACGIRPEHYNTVGRALLWTLARGLGKDFTPEVKQAWAEVYETLVTTMQRAAF